MASFSQIPGLTEDELEYGHQVIKQMNYNSQRITRQISVLPGANFPQCREIWKELENKNASYNQILAFEEWTKLPDATMPLAVQVLRSIKELTHEEVKCLRAFLGISRQKADAVLALIPQIVAMESSGNFAARKMFSVRGITVEQALNNLSLIDTFTDKQAWAYAAFAETRRMGAETVTDALPLFQQLRDDAAWNMRTLIKKDKLNRNAAWRWLISYFAHPVHVQEKQYYRYDGRERTQLLDAFYAAGEELIWKINSLHAVSDEYGMEISSASLQAMSRKELQGLFAKLSQKTKVNYGGHFLAAYKAGKKNTMIRVLRKATTADRTQVSQDLTSANIYTLLAQGSELYDSSFRDILVPILKKRIHKKYQNNLLIFLKATDPNNLLVSSFIVSLAQKGKLTTFFPNKASEQEKILDLVAASAFKDEDTILLFSATFRHLLKVLDPEVRFYLIKKMVLADNGRGSFSKLLTVILQYYLQEYPDLLNASSRQLIQQTVDRNGAVDLNKYLQTPFGEWKEDKRLGSISVFHPDDDGRKSFVSNAQTLLKHGYSMAFSKQYSPYQDASTREMSKRALQRARSGKGLAALFDTMRRNPFAAAFVKKVKGITISHAVYVYANEADQQLLMKRFLQGDDEMFAQRGHSYWRSEQITDPLEKLKENNQITANDLTRRQRFFSLGSCGGVKAYTKLTRMFLGHIDILATIGTGMAIINDPYNRNFFEIVAKTPSSITWEDMAAKSSFIFANGRGQDYLQPGCLTAILHKILDEERMRRDNFSDSLEELSPGAELEQEINAP
ncbi:MAG: hypothetical protein WGN25_06455 [Candidatus Electrothrix sp. GW3-4]|uniref:hypothetical protein n=1 Tax=Candidatus Electrothrix sp. GW3-4 TaxID=3126740 RepID=UPI0030D601A5